MSQTKSMGISRSNRILLVLSKWMSALLFWLSIFNVGFSIIYFRDWRRIERCNYCDDHSIWFRLTDHLRFIDFPRFYLNDYGTRQVEAQAVRWFILIFLVITICSTLYFQNARRKLDAFKPKVDHSPIPAVTEEVKVETIKIQAPVPVKLSQITKTPAVVKTTKAPTAQKKRPDVTIGMMGHLDHGKTTLLAAISKTLSGRGLAELRSFDEVNLALQKEVEGAQGAILRSEYEFGKRKYEHVDIPGHEAYNKRMLSEAAEWDGAILVVSVIEGPMPQTRDHVIAARQVGLSHLVVALNMSDLTVDKELFEFVELEMRELLSEFGFPGDSTPIVHISGLKALMGAQSWQNKIMELLAAIDSLIPPSNRGQIKRESGSSSKRLKDVQAKDPKMLNFLAKNFHQRFQELENHYRSGLFLSGEISEVAERIWKLSQLWMIFLDGDDLSFTQDHELYRHISDLANSHPRCTIEEEVSHWMSMVAGQMTDFEIRLALWCGVDRVGSLLVLNGNFDETLDELIQHRNRVNPAFRGK